LVLYLLHFVALDKNMTDPDFTDMDAIRIVRPDGVVAARVAFLATLYYRSPGKPEQRHHVGAATAKFLQRFGGAIRWSKPLQKSKAVVVSGLVPNDLAALFAQTDPRDDLSFYAHSGEAARDAGLVMIDVFAPLDTPFPQLGHISVSVAADMPSPTGSRELRLIVSELCEIVRPFHGYAGLGLVRCPNPYPAREAEPYLIDFAGKFPGLLIDMPISYAQQLEEGILGVNWQTVLGPEMVGKLGDREKLIAATNETGLETATHGGALIIQAGPVPVMSGPKGSVPEPYCRANALLKSLRAPFQSVIIESEMEGLDRGAFTCAWLNRFD
jgi:hypothetical protein